MINYFEIKRLFWEHFKTFNFAKSFKKNKAFATKPHWRSSKKEKWIQFKFRRRKFPHSSFALQWHSPFCIVWEIQIREKEKSIV